MPYLDASDHPELFVPTAFLSISSTWARPGPVDLDTWAVLP
jgi:hypothetical protein